MSDNLYGNSINLYDAVYGNVIGQMDNGTVLYVYEAIAAQDGSVWYQVNYNGQDGYVRCDMAQKLTGVQLQAHLAEQVEEIPKPVSDTTQLKTALQSDFEYSLQTDGTVAITGYEGPLTQFAIPSFINGRKVTVIASRAFDKMYSLQKIQLPSTITSINNYAFSWCNNLEEINIPEGVKTIGNHAFMHCMSMKQLILPAGLESLGNNPFFGTTAFIEFSAGNTRYKVEDGSLYDMELKKLVHYGGLRTRVSFTVPDDVEIIGCGAFSWGGGTFALHGNLREIILPDNLKTIENDAFMGCSSLEELIIPEGVISIGTWAFNQCHALKTVTIPKSVKRIGEGLFALCEQQIQVVVSKGSYADMNMGNYKGDADVKIIHEEKSSALLDLDAASIGVGDVVRFGCYEQDGNFGNGKEPIEWVVMRKDGNVALLFSVDILDAQPYDQKGQATRWEESSIRAWLNREFLNEAFSETDKTKMLWRETKTRYRGQMNAKDDLVYLLGYDLNEIYGLGLGMVFIPDNYEWASELKNTGIENFENAEATTYAMSCNANAGDYYWELDGSAKRVNNAFYKMPANNVYGVRPACWVYLGK